MQGSLQFAQSERLNAGIPYPFLFCISFLVWLIGTIAFRFWGQFFFIPDNRISMIGSFLALLVVMPVVVNTTLRWSQLNAAQRSEAVICLVLPSMLLDVLSVYCFPQLFPNLLPTVAAPFAAWLLWGYAIAMITPLSQSIFRR